MFENLNAGYVQLFVLILSLVLTGLYLFINIKKEKNKGPTRKAAFHRRKTWFFGFSIFFLAAIFVSEQYFVIIVLVCWYLFIEYSYRKDLEKSVDNLESITKELQKQKQYLESELNKTKNE